MQRVYLDSSALVKRYVAENGSEDVARIYEQSNALETVISFSIWNLGETIGVIDHYRSKGWLTEDQTLQALGNLAGETLRLSRIEALELLPVDPSSLADSWDLVRNHHIYQADALQIVSCKRSGTRTLVSADRALLAASKSEGLDAVDIEDHDEVEERL